MVAAVGDGTARAVSLPGIEVAAKTGTAERGDHSHGWMVAFAPAREPVIALAVFVEGAPGAPRSGERDAAPVARAVLQAVLTSG
jgi:peptidoglycan glycosyltransferase